MGKWDDDIPLQPRGSVQPSSVAALLRTLKLADASAGDQSVGIRAWLKNHKPKPRHGIQPAPEGLRQPARQPRDRLVMSRHPATEGLEEDSNAATVVVYSTSMSRNRPESAGSSRMGPARRIGERLTRTVEFGDRPDRIGGRDW